VAAPPLPGFNPEPFLKYKEAKLKEIADIESKRLDDLKDSRHIVFKYALPVSVIDAVAGGVGAILNQNIWILLPITIFIILIYLLANNLDLQKYGERTDIMNRTDKGLHEIRQQENELLKRAF
jgi:hypothetical protein